MADGTPHQLDSIQPDDFGHDGEVLPPMRRPERSAARARRAWLLTGEAIVEFLLIAVMIALLWGTIALDLAQQRKQLADGARRDSSNLARAAAESIGQVVTGVDDVLQLSRVARNSDPQSFNIAAWASRVNAGRPVALELALVDQKGQLAASSLGPVQNRIDLSQADFFRHQAADDTDNLFIGRPAAGSGKTTWSVLFSRRLASPDGVFAGCMVAAIDASWLSRLYHVLDIGHGTLMLVGSDGVVRAYAAGGGADSEGAIGRDIAASDLMKAAAASDRGAILAPSPLDQSPQFIGFQRLQAYPLVVAIALDAHEVLAPYRIYARRELVFGACLTLLILSVGLFLLGNTRRILVSRQLLQDAVDAISQGIIMVDRNGYVSVVNRRIRQLLALPDAAAEGRVKLGHLEHEAAIPPAGDDSDDLRDGFEPQEQTRADGTIFEIQTHQLEDGGFVRTYADVTERKRAELKITYLAYHDALTGLANRRLFRDRLANAVGKCRHGALGCAVLSVDLDGFKYANDMYGHMFGDAVLLEVTSRLTEAAGNAAVVARFGGDEFFVLMETLRQPDAAKLLARRLLGLLGEPYIIEGRELLISASIGIAQCPADALTVDDILTNADTALFAAKEAGRNTVRSYDPAMAARTSERRQIEQDLRTALALDQMHVVYQPVFDCASWRICRFEALLRWTHPARGDISPEIFIPVAEETGLIVALGHWVLETACAEAAGWPPDVDVAVNLSPKQFLQADLVRSISSVLAKTGLAADRLTVEVTEGVLIDNVERASAALSTLKALGVRIALDDFGTGYSSLSYLHRFPISSIKIDKSFVKPIGRSADADAIVRAILTLGHSLGLRVVAEGIEEKAQLEWLLRAGCSEVQGYLLGRAIPSAAVKTCLEQAAENPSLL
jgi:diguanylate cyclase (GGDEF)-like protein